MCLDSIEVKFSKDDIQIKLNLDKTKMLICEIQSQSHETQYINSSNYKKMKSVVYVNQHQYLKLSLIN